MKINIENLDVEELEELMDCAGQKRAGIHPEIPRNAPNDPKAIHDPVWHVSQYEGGTLLQFRDPGPGWVAFTIPPLERAELLFALHNQVIPAIQMEIHNLTVENKKPKRGK